MSIPPISRTRNRGRSWSRHAGCNRRFSPRRKKGETAAEELESRAFRDVLIEQEHALVAPGRKPDFVRNGEDRRLVLSLEHRKANEIELCRSRYSARRRPGMIAPWAAATMRLGAYEAPTLAARPSSFFGSAPRQLYLSRPPVYTNRGISGGNRA